MKIMLWLLVVLIAGGCARPDLPPIPLPDVEDLVQRITAGSVTYQSLDAEAKVGIRVADKYISTRQFLLLDKPDRLRSDVLTTFGQLALQLAVDQDDLRVFLNTTVPGKYYQGPASNENLLRFTRLPVSFEDLVRLLLYDLPMISGQKIQVKTHERGAQLVISSKTERQVIVFDRQLRPVESRYFRDQSLWLQVNYDDFSDEVGFPQKVQLELPEQKTRASIKYSETRLNVEIPAERFIVKQPAGAELVRLPD